MLVLSCCRNLSKAKGRNAGLIPSPLSATRSRACWSTVSRETSTSPPAGVNLMAFDSRLDTACCSRPGSPLTQIGTLPGRPREGQALEGRVARRGIDGDLDHAPDVDELRVEHEPACGDARRVEQVFDDALQRACAALDDLERTLPLGGIEPALPQEAEPHQDRSQGRAQLVGKQGQELVLEMARRLRPMPRGLLPLHEAGDVASDEAAVDESAVAEEPASIDQDLLDGAVLGSKAGLIGSDALLAGEPAEDVGGGLRLDEKLGDVLADVLGLGVPDEVQLGPVRPEDAPVGAHPAQADRGVIEELAQLLVALGQSHLALALSSVAACRKADDDGDQLGRLHRLGQV